MRGILERAFKVTTLGSTIQTELVGGAATFFTLSYIIFVQPAILSAAGMDFGAVLTVTCIASAITTICMGILTNYPFALAPGMGHNVFFVFTVCGALTAGGLGYTWQEALGAVFWAGIIFLLVAVSGVQVKIIDAIPDGLKHGIGVGIGLLITVLGLEWAGIIADNPATLVSIGDISSPPVLLAIAGTLITAILINLRVFGAILWGILTTAVLGIIFGIVSYQGTFSLPPSFSPTAFKLDIFGVFSKPDFITVIVLFFFLDIFDTIGTLVGLSNYAGFFKNGKLPKASRVLGVDAFGTVLGSLFGTSTITTYLESASGIISGARTGLAPIMTGILLFASLFFYPLIKMVAGGYPITGGVTLYPIIAPVLIIVGSFMITSVKAIKWDNPGESLPAFLMIMSMPLTFSITEGISFGFISYAVINLFSKRWRSVHPMMYILAVLFLIRYMLM